MKCFFAFFTADKKVRGHPLTGNIVKIEAWHKKRWIFAPFCYSFWDKQNHFS